MATSLTSLNLWMSRQVTSLSSEGERCDAGHLARLQEDPEASQEVFTAQRNSDENGSQVEREERACQEVCRKIRRFEPSARAPHASKAVQPRHEAFTYRPSHVSVLSVRLPLVREGVGPVNRLSTP